jgi:hypothetical protein
MTYKEAEDILYKTKWKTKTCSQGAKCWCRMIVPVKKILHDGTYSEGIYIAGSGELTKRAAEYFVKLHNKEIAEAK